MAWCGLFRGWGHFFRLGLRYTVYDLLDEVLDLRLGQFSLQEIQGVTFF